jgi:hypothetical protein
MFKVFWEDGEEYGVLHSNTVATKCSNQLMYPGSNQLMYPGSNQLMYQGSNQLMYQGSNQLMYPGSMTLHNSHTLLDDKLRHQTVLEKRYVPMPTKNQRYYPHTSMYRQGALRTTWGRQPPALTMTKQYSGSNGQENPPANEEQDK